MDFTQLSTEQLIDIIHRQADDIAALEMELAFVKENKKLQELPLKERLKHQPVEIDGELWFFAVPRWIKNGKVHTAEQVMNNEALLRSILSDANQTILKRFY